MDGIQAIKKEKNLTAITVRRSNKDGGASVLLDGSVRGVIMPTPNETVIITDERTAGRINGEAAEAGVSIETEDGLGSLTVCGDCMLGKDAIGARLLSLLHAGGVYERFVSVSEIVFTVYLPEKDIDRAWTILVNEI